MNSVLALLLLAGVLISGCNQTVSKKCEVLSAEGVRVIEPVETCQKPYTKE